MDAFDFFESSCRAVGDDHARRPIAQTIPLHQMPGQGDRRTAGAHREHFGPRLFEMIGLQEAVDRQAGGDRVLRMADEAAIAFGQAARFAHRRGERIDFVEQIAARGEEIDLVRRHQRAFGQRVVLDELDGFPIDLWRCVDGQVDALHFDVAEIKQASPGWKHLHDRTLGGRYADEVERAAGCCGVACVRRAHAAFS